ncbi:Hypp7091 [Branchiostoma lanceolatum]|uniref:Hypp7091 protein n=1 Tax=Branchiostoma lanceolatum TaxID=7740 RepID=A0A8J9YXI1_BRALA|nr:Hypp7091 [Branchiostoma lanceolatum]
MHSIPPEMPTTYEVVTRDRHIPTEMSDRSLQPVSVMSVNTRVHLSTPGGPASSATLLEDRDLPKSGGRLTSWRMLEQLHPIRSVVLSRSYRKPAVPPPPPSPTSERGRVKRKPSRRSTTSSQSSRKSGSGSPFWRTARDSPRGAKKGSRSPSRTAAVASPLLSPKNSFGASRSQSPTRSGSSSAKAGSNRAPLRTEESVKVNGPKLSSPRQSLLTKADVPPETGSSEKTPAGDKPVLTPGGAFELIRTSSVSKGNKMSTVFDTKTEPPPTH